MSGSHEVMMQMSPWNFDQSADGWRKLDSSGKSLEAVAVIEEYIARNKDRILNPIDGEQSISLGIMYFHIGQLLAMEGQGYKLKAIDAFNQAFSENSECWNAYVSATIGFLKNDISAVKTAIQTIENSKQKNKVSGNISIVKNFSKALKQGELDYEKVYCHWPRDNED